MNPIVRKATLEDLPVLLEFEQGLIKAERPMDPNLKEGRISYYDLGEFITGKDADLYVVTLNQEIVASGYVKIIADRPYLKHSDMAYLGFMFVPEKHRGNGYNQLILDALIEWSKARGIQEIRLDVYDQNDSALRAYQKAGFKNYLINMRLDI
ncbi:MAG: GNAT family N-acetyltransferase [Gilvibacter sp.]